MDQRIRAHVLICLLALLLIRVAETRTDDTWRTIRAELGTIRQGHFRSRDGEFTQTTELTAANASYTARSDPRATALRTPHARLTPQPVGTRRTSCTKSSIALPIRDCGLPALPTSCGTRVHAVAKNSETRPQTTTRQRTRRRRKLLQTARIRLLAAADGRTRDPLTMEVLYQLS